MDGRSREFFPTCHDFISSFVMINDVLTSDDRVWRGVHVSELRTSFNQFQYPELIPDEEHTIFVKVGFINSPASIMLLQ